jgi:hypothetical protein
VTPSADESPARTSILVRLSQSGLVGLALFYALVLGTTLPIGTLASTTIDRIQRLDLRFDRLIAAAAALEIRQARVDERAEAIQH